LENFQLCGETCFAGAEILRRKTDEVTRSWRKLHNEELHNLYSSPSIIQMFKSRRMRCAGHVARMVGKRNAYSILEESQKERDHWENQDVGGCTVL
jgi:hypothetical protein